MSRVFADWPEMIERTIIIATKCKFSLDELGYEYPIDPVAEEKQPQDELISLTWIGANERFPGGIPKKVKKQVEYELKLIQEFKCELSAKRRFRRTL